LKRLLHAKTQLIFPGCFGRDALFLAVLRMPPPMASGCALWTHQGIGRGRPERAKIA
jgi:hypothetical protein